VTAASTAPLADRTTSPIARDGDGTKPFYIGEPDPRPDQL
jgi:hypothetical protein